MSDRIMGHLPDGTPVTCDNAGRVVPVKPATVQAMGADGCTYEVSLAVASGPHRFVCGEPLPEPDPADRRIIAWMPVEYMEAARAGQGKPDALEVAQLAGYLKVGDVVRVKDLGPTMLELFPCTCADCADTPEAKPEPECGVWLISPSSLPREMRNGAQGGKGKAKGRTMVYDFEEVP